MMSGEKPSVTPQVSKAQKKQTKMPIVAIILGVIVILAVLVGSVYILNNLGEQHPENNTPASGYNTYSNYRFSLQYPKGMNITEKGMLQSQATNSSGIISGEINNNSEYERIKVGWMSSAVAAPLESALEGGFIALEKEYDVQRGEIVKSIKDGYTLEYQYYNTTIANKSAYGILGVWYNDATDRFYELAYTSNNSTNLLPNFQKYLNSFVG